MLPAPSRPSNRQAIDAKARLVEPVCEVAVAFVDAM